MKKFRKFEVTAVPFNGEELSGFLWEDGVAGITENENSLTLYSEETSKIDKSLLIDLLNKLKEKDVIKEYSIVEEILEDQNWNADWEKNLNVIEVSDRFVIKPSFKEYIQKQNQVVITVDPKMSFGTGEHETTKLMLLLLDKYFSNHQKVLDIGSGTAVLAIAAAKLGAHKVLGIDNDEWCLLNGKENAQANSVLDRVEIEQKEISEVEIVDFDLILANINRHILMEISEEIKAKISENGVLILSGLLLNDKDDIEKLYSGKGFELIETLEMNEWIGMVFKNSGDLI